MKAADFAIRHPAVIGILLISLALFGFLSFRGMSRDLLANITTPEILVLTVYPGASPEVIEEDVTDPLEEEFSLIEGIEKISSDSKDGYSLVFITMDWDADLDAKKNDIRDRINNASARLPDGIEGHPRLFELGTSSLPVYTCLVESDLPESELARILEDDIVPRFSRVADVSAVYARGTEAPAVRVRLHPAKLDSMGITALEAYGAVAQGQGNVPAGDVDIGADRLTLQSEGDYSSLQRIGRQPVGYAPSGRPIYLEDVAELRMGTENPEFRASSGGKRTVALDVMKRPGGDSEDLVQGIRRLQRDLTAESGGRIRFRPVLDDAETIGITLSSVSRSAWAGGLLAVVILLLFLHDIRAALIVTLSIPFTVFLTFILMRARGMTLNIMTLAGITVSIGMVVDSSIVILENTLRHRKIGRSAPEAASIGAGEVGGAVLASTSTSLSVFIPILFVSGLAGAILKEVAWVLVFALSSSAATAIFIVPWLSSRILDADGRSGLLSRFGRRFESGFARLVGAYSRILAAALDRKGFVVAFSAILVAASLAVLASLGGEMFSAPDMNEFEVTVRLPSGYNLDKAEAKMEEIAGVVREHVPEISTDLWYAGLGDAATIVDRGTPSSGYGRIRLTRAGRRERSVFEIVRSLNRILPAAVADADITVRNGGLAKQMDYATDGAGFRVELSGSDWNQVLESAAILQRRMLDDPLVHRTSIDVRLDRESMIVDIDREQAGRLAVSPGAAGMNLRVLFAGIEAGYLDTATGRHPIIIDSLLADGGMPPGILGRIQVRNEAGQAVPYSAFAALERRGSTDSIPHRDRLPALIVVGELTENDLSGVRGRLEPALRGMNFPPGVTWRIVGAADVMGDTFRELGRALGIAIFLVYAVMVIQFERFTQPFIIMGSVPFVLIGVAAALAAFGTRISMMTFFGVIALGGMVVNNAIVLVEFANQRRREGADIRSAVLDAARIRLKPILITTLTTLLGLIPLAFSLSEGSQIYAPLGQVIGGGLVTSTLITLVLVPVLYEAMERRTSRRGRNRIQSGGTLLVLLFLTAVFPREAFAEGAAHTEGSWTMESLTERALDDAPALLSARREAEVASARLQGARAQRGPTLDVELGTTYNSDPLLRVPAGALGSFPVTLPPPLGGMPLPSEDTDVWGSAHEFRYDLSAVLEQPLYTWGRISSGVRIAESGKSAALWNVQSREIEIIAGVRIACESLVLVRRMHELAQEQERLGRRLSDLSLRNYEEGFLLETEYRHTRDRVRQILLAASTLERQEHELLLSLERATGLDHLETDHLSLPQVEENLEAYEWPSPDRIVAMALETNPDLAAQRALASLADSEMELARGNRTVKPDVAFRAEFGYGGAYSGTPDSLDGAWRLTLGARSTVFDSGRSRAGIRAAEAERDAAYARSEDGRRQVESIIRSSLHAMDLNREDASYYSGIRDTDAARAAERRDSWEAGFGREEEWLLAELDRLTAELRRLGAVLAYIRLDRHVRSISGIPF